MAAKAESKRGPKPKYDESYVEIGRNAVLDGGFSYAKIGRLFGVSKSTIMRWRRKYPDFDKAISSAQDWYAKDKLVGSLYKLANGYRHTEKTEMLLRDSKGVPILDKDGNRQMVEVKRVTKHAAPNFQAIRFGLLNAAPDRFKDKQGEDDGNGFEDSLDGLE
ncbi:MAG: helix-turn-helix domain-containing protein [Desulfovibrio sp.]